MCIYRPLYFLLSSCESKGSCGWQVHRQDKTEGNGMKCFSEGLRIRVDLESKM